MAREHDISGRFDGISSAGGAKQVLKRDRELTRKSVLVMAVIFIAAACNSMVAARSAASVFLGPISHQFAWTHAQVGAAISFLMMGIAVGTPVLGWLIDRYGPRIVLLPLTAAAGLTLMGFSLTGGVLALFYAAHFVLGVASPGPLAYTKLLATWFSRRRGIALFSISFGFFIAQVAIPPVARGLGVLVGWQGTYLVFGLLELATALPLLALFFREKPSNAGGARDGALRHEDAPSIRYRDILADRDFWLILGAQLASGSVWLGLLTHAIGILGQRGLTSTAATWGISLFAIGGVAAQGVQGLLFDRLNTPKVLIPFGVISLVALVALTRSSSGSAALMAMLALGIGIIGQSGTSYLTTRYFGVRNFGLAYGVMAPFLLMLEAPAPMLVGAVFDRTGSYDAALWFLAACLAAAILMLLSLRAFPDPVGGSSPTDRTG